MSGSYSQRRENDKSKLAEARRLYHHVCNGGTLTPEDVSFMVVALEEAYEYAEVDRLRAKKKQIYEDLKSEQTHNTKGELKYDPETGEPLIDGYPLYSGLPKREDDAPYDQTALELCERCGWKTVVPDDGCLNCNRREWVGLTTEEFIHISYEHQRYDESNEPWFDRGGFARAIEQLLKEKNA